MGHIETLKQKLLNTRKAFEENKVERKRLMIKRRDDIRALSAAGFSQNDTGKFLSLSTPTISQHVRQGNTAEEWLKENGYLDPTD